MCVDAFGGETEREFAKRGEVGFAEKIIFRIGGTIAEINFSFPQTITERLWRDVHQLDFLRQVDDRIRHSFRNDGSGDLANCIGAALDVLDVQCSVNVNTGGEQLDHVLVPFRVP